MEQFQELAELLELQLEGRISAKQFRRLEDLIRVDVVARRFYREYVDLHGMLYWDAANASEGELTEDVASTGEVELSSVLSTGADRGSLADDTGRKRRRRILVTTVSACVLLLAVWPLAFDGDNRGDRDVAGNEPGVTDVLPERETPNGLLVSEPEGDGEKTDGTLRQPVRLPGESSLAAVDTGAAGSHMPDKPSEQPAETVVADATPDAASNGGADSSYGATVEFINQQLASRWAEASVEPSPMADDAEWLRRVTLDIVGHIPSASEVGEFLADKSPNKRQSVIDELLDDEDYIRNWTTIWSNRLIGRSNPREVNRPSLEKFLRETFARNEGWDRTVAEFISAQGSNKENGATNFLLAHVNNQAVPATAITARLFLGLQIQCTQCHPHPFNDKTQDDFWSFNSCFEQIKKTRPMTSQGDEVFLIDEPRGGPTLYETRSGLIRVAFPRFDGKVIPAEETVNRRQELARIMTTGETTQVARAFVNRMWHHFFGAGFTHNVEDMGPHVAVSHPMLLDQLTRDFVTSGYDVKQLIRWICQSEAYGLTSRTTGANLADNPEIGNTPLFSRVYVKQMSVEQMFDSLLIATQAREVFGSDWESVEHRRQEWLQQFVMAWQTDENDEADLFSGTISQALMMMNGELVDLALSFGKGTYLDRVARSSRSENEKIEAIALATLSRKPSRTELSAVRKLMQDRVAGQPRGVDRTVAVRSSLQDLFWACLNSNEFILIH